jgi:GTP diphosphokinase / guanosine-3',5'-bis(diphosphate) 3'-diphosphatase
MRRPLVRTGGGYGSGLLAGLLRDVQGVRPDADFALIARAYRVAESWHQGQSRMSGDPYITHPVAVAAILAGAGADDPALCAALLHDVRGMAGGAADVVEAEFGAEIAGLVREVCALDPAGDKAGAAPLADPGTNLGRDSRAYLIKMADRLHNLRTIRYLPTAVQVDRSLQTLQVHVPLARSLGAETLGTELADLACATLRRHYQGHTASGRIMRSSALLLPRAVRARWSEEWLAELHLHSTRRARAVFAAQIAVAAGRMAVSLRSPAAKLGKPGRIDDAGS